MSTNHRRFSAANLRADSTTTRALKVTGAATDPTAANVLAVDSANNAVVRPASSLPDMVILDAESPTFAAWSVSGAASAATTINQGTMYAFRSGQVVHATCTFRLSIDAISASNGYAYLSSTISLPLAYNTNLGYLAHASIATYESNVLGPAVVSNTVLLGDGTTALLRFVIQHNAATSLPSTITPWFRLNVIYPVYLVEPE